MDFCEPAVIIHKTQCKFFVPRKKRFCRIAPREGEDYCPEHQEVHDDVISDDQRVRIVCPLDKKHTCYANKLKKHLKICNARQGTVPPYINKDINSGEDISVRNECKLRLLSEYPVNDIMKTITKINKVYQDLVNGKITNKQLQHIVVEEEMKKPEYGDKSKKHLKQASAILGLLNDYSMLNSETCYLEFGAGRGQLSCWIMKATEQLDNIRVLLVEKASPKHKQDNKLSRSSLKIRRIRADICDLVLDNLEEIKEAKKIVGVTKHLCGEATDLALRCMGNVEENSEKVFGCLMTFCCHHRCKWVPYVGKQFFEKAGLGQTDFEIMRGISSWATCGTGFSRERRKTMNTEECMEINNDRDIEIGLKREEKEEIGKKCKNIINWGRLVYLENLGFNCLLHYYVDASISPENVCIVAVKNEVQ